MHLHAALVTALTTILLTYAMAMVGRARGLTGIHAPATSGHPDFERAFRAHANTIEQVAVFLPVLWLASIYSGYELVAAAFGYLWLIGRLLYIVGYARAAEKRSLGFLIGGIAYVALLGLSLWGIGRGLLGG